MTQNGRSFAPFLIENLRQGGRRPRDHLRVLDGVLYVTRTGVPWRDLPPEFGNWNSVYRQYRRWTEAGVWDVILAALYNSEASDNTLQMIDSTIVRVHQHGAGGRGKFKETVLAVRGWQPTKVHTRANAEGLAVGFHVTPGQALEITAYDDLIAEDAPPPEAMLGDKGYDSDAIRSNLERRGIDPVIPTKSNRKVQRIIDKAANAMRNRIERFFNKLILGFVQLATIRCWIKFVHPA